MFYEEHPAKYEPVERVMTSSPLRFTRESIARGLDAAKADAEGFHGRRLALATPDMQPMGLHVERIGGVRKHGGNDLQPTRFSWRLKGTA
jgi:hypothetical protein